MFKHHKAIFIEVGLYDCEITCLHSIGKREVAHAYSHHRVSRSPSDPSSFPTQIPDLIRD